MTPPEHVISIFYVCGYFNIFGTFLPVNSALKDNLKPDRGLYSSVDQSYRFQRFALSQDTANTDSLPVAKATQFSEAGLDRFGGHAGEQAAGGLRVEEQGIARVVDEGFGIAQRPAQAYVGRLQ